MTQNRQYLFDMSYLGSFRSVNRSRNWCFKIFWSRSGVRVWKIWLRSSLTRISKLSDLFNTSLAYGKWQLITPNVRVETLENVEDED